MTHTATVVLLRTKEFKQLDTKSLGQLSRASNELKTDEGVTLTCPHKLNDQYVRVENRQIDTRLQAREFGAEMFSLFKGKADTLTFAMAHEFNGDIEEGAELASYQFLKYKTTAKPHRLQTIQITVKDSLSLTDSINSARDVITEPGNVLFPAEYASRINKTLTPL